MKRAALEKSTKHTGEKAIAALLRESAKKRAAAMKWNTRIVMLFYALFAGVGLLRLEGANVLFVMAVAAVGLAVLWVVFRVHWKKLEERLFREELEEYNKIVSAGAKTPVVTEPEFPATALLSRRELEVLAQVARGKSNKEIAAEMCLSPQTVKNHIAHIMTKLDVRDRTSAAITAVSQGWISCKPGPVTELPPGIMAE